MNYALEISTIESMRYDKTCSRGIPLHILYFAFKWKPSLRFKMALAYNNCNGYFLNGIGLHQLNWIHWKIVETLKDSLLLPLFGVMLPDSN